MTWVASELLTGLAFTLEAWRSFKLLKNSGVDFNLLKTWVLLALLQVFEEYAEFLVAWIPLYYLGKCALLVIVMLPDSNFATLLFDRVVVPGMDLCHHALNHLVIPNVISAGTALLWGAVLAVCPILIESDDFVNVVPAEAPGNARTAGGKGPASNRSLTPTRRTPRAMPPSPCQVSRLTASSKKIGFFSDLHHLKRAPPTTPATQQQQQLQQAGSGSGSGASETASALRQRPAALKGAGAAVPAAGDDWEVVAAAAAAGVGARAGRAAAVDEERDRDDTPPPLLEPLTPVMQQLQRPGRSTLSAIDGSSSSSSNNTTSARGDMTIMSDLDLPPVTPTPSGGSGSGSGAFMALGSPPGGGGSSAAGSGGRSSSGGGLSSFLRRTFTGDANIRLRDHLFDLKTSSPPIPAELAPALLSPAGSPGGGRRLTARAAAARRSHGGGAAALLGRAAREDSGDLSVDDSSTASSDLGREKRRSKGGGGSAERSGSSSSRRGAAAAAGSTLGPPTTRRPSFDLRQQSRKRSAAAGLPADASSASGGGGSGGSDGAAGSGKVRAEASGTAKRTTSAAPSERLASQAALLPPADQQFVAIGGTGGGGGGGSNSVGSTGSGGSSGPSNSNSPAARLMGWKRASLRSSRGTVGATAAAYNSSRPTNAAATAEAAAADTGTGTAASAAPDGGSRPLSARLPSTFQASGGRVLRSNSSKSGSLKGTLDSSGGSSGALASDEAPGRPLSGIAGTRALSSRKQPSLSPPPSRNAEVSG